MSKGVELTYKQTLTLDYLEDDITTEVLMGGAAGGAKSFIGCYFSLKMCMKYPGVRGLIGRSKLKSLKESTLKTFFEVCGIMGLRADRDFFYNSTDSIIKFENGSEILLKDLFLYPSDPNFDSLGSVEISFAFIDEANQITLKAKNVVKSRIRFKLEDFNLIPKILLTCNPARNWVYTDFYKPSIDNTLPDNRKFVQALLTDNPFISKHYKENLESLDEVSKQRLLHGNWDYNSSPNRMISFDSIVNIFRKPDAEELKGLSNYMSIDVARFGKDKTVIMRWKGLHVVELVEIAKSGLDVVVKVAKDIAFKHKIPNRNIIADSDGIGAGVIDFWGGIEGFVNNSRALDGGNYSNLKSQCAYLLARKINKGEVTIYDTEARDLIIEELEQIKTYKIDSDVKLQILPKDKIKELIGRSPDYSDTLMMRMYFEIAVGSANYAIR